MLHTNARAIDTELLYIHRAIFHEFVDNGIRMPFFNN
ncbi:RAxF-45 family protein [Radiobacillus sp. PE A8.2]